MKIMTNTIICILLVTAASADDCKPSKLSDQAIKLIKPLMELRVRQNKEQFTEDGRWRGESQYTPDVEKRFYSILKNRSKAGDEAVAYLLNVYMGEHSGEELVCEVINRGKRMLPLIREYKKCIPLIGIEPLHKFVRGSGYLPQYAEEGILKDEKCTHE
ncbi:MAG: hypothetical protein HY035_08125 [Nitrospirae bacterium]|nr:hypothetical protein [Nitrospirota bacterium]MBI3378348.1 hypothetical protein [Nitrospirota bacterium]